MDQCVILLLPKGAVETSWHLELECLSGYFVHWLKLWSTFAEMLLRTPDHWRLSPYVRRRYSDWRKKNPLSSLLLIGRKYGRNSLYVHKSCSLYLDKSDLIVTVGCVIKVLNWLDLLVVRVRLYVVSLVEIDVICNHRGCIYGLFLQTFRKLIGQG